MELDEMEAAPILRTDFIYLRFIGDRSIPESKLETLQKERSGEMQYWVDEITKLKNSDLFKLRFVAANNHYAGFGHAYPSHTASALH
jgi:hypothetical protein